MSSFATYFLLVLLLILFVWLAYHLKKDKRANPLQLVTVPLSGRLSAAKVGQLVGLVVSTWVIVSLTQVGNLSYEILLVYLSYVAGVDLFGKYLRSKDTSSKEITTTTSTSIKQEPPAPPTKDVSE